MKLNKKGYNAVLSAAVAASSLLLVACGGGGGGGDSSSSSVTYTGVTTAAAVDNEAAAVKYSQTAVSGDLPSSSGLLTGVSVGSAGTASFVERMRSLADSVMGMDYTSMASDTVVGATASDVELGCTGSASVTVNYDDLDYSGTFTGYDRLLNATITYSNFKERNDDGSCSTITSNGSATITFHYDDPSNDLYVTGMTLSTPALATTDAAGATETMTGSFAINMYPGPDISLTLSADYKDASGVVYRAKDYQIVLSYDGIVSVDGILCDPAEGCIEIVTNPVFAYDTYTCSYPISGILTIYGYDWVAATRTSEHITVDAGIDGACNTYQVSWTPSDGNTQYVSPNPYW